MDEVCPTCGATIPSEQEKRLKPHGTMAAVRRHERAGEPLCEPCVAARKHYNHVQYNKRWDVT